MKKMLIICFFIFGINYFLLGQNYITYHKTISSAENEVVDSNYAAALEIYRSIYRDYDFIYARHCYTAIQLSIKEKKEDLTFLFLEKGIKQGLTLNLIEKAPIINQITKNKNWENFKNMKYDSLRKEYLSTINIRLRDEIEKLFAIDQHYTQMVNRSKFISRPFKNKKWKREIGELIGTKLIAIIKEYGFPGEKLIGLMESPICYTESGKINDNLLEKKYNQWGEWLGNLSAQYMLIHYFSTSQPNFNSLLKQEIQKGNIEPYQYASICDFQAKYGGKHKNEGYYNQWHRDMSVENRNNINKRRLSIGLETFEELRRKETRNYTILKEIEKGNYNHIKLQTIWGGY